MRKELLRAADGRTVIQYLALRYGLETQVRNGRTMVKCPCHPRILGKIDRNFGNAYAVKAGLQCWGCGKKPQPILDVVMDHLHCSDEEAFRVICDAMSYSGDPEWKKLSESQEAKAPAAYLTAENRATIKIACPQFVMINGHTEGLSALYERDPAAYYGLIADRAEEIGRRYAGILQKYASEDSPESYRVYELIGSEKYDSSIMYALRIELKKRIDSCHTTAAINRRLAERA